MNQEIERKGRSTSWCFAIYNGLGGYRFVHSRESAEAAERDGFNFLDIPESVGDVQHHKTALIECTMCGDKVAPRHMDNGLCPSCIAGLGE